MNEKSNCLAEKSISELEEILRRFDSLTGRNYEVNLRLETVCRKLKPLSEDDGKKPNAVYLDSIIGKFNEGLDVYVERIIKTEQLVSHLEGII